MYTIATLDRFRQYLGVNPGVDDGRLLATLQIVTAQIERRTNRHFCPRVAARAHSVIPYLPSELLLDDDLLELTSVTHYDGSAIDPTEIVLLPGDKPTSVLQLRNGLTFTWQDSPIRSTIVAGVWGWHTDWTGAWRDSADGVTATLKAKDIRLTVERADGADSENESPRFQVGQLLRIGDEYLWVLDVTINPRGADTLTVTRGANGTTTTTHNLGALIEIYQPALDIVMLVLRWAAWLYREPDAMLDGGLPLQFERELQRYQRVGVRG